MKYLPIVIVFIILGVLGAWYLGHRPFSLPEGETLVLEEAETEEETETLEEETEGQEVSLSEVKVEKPTTLRKVLVTDGVKHSIPLDEILSGGPGKDGIPSIDSPKFIQASQADFLSDDDVGIGLTIKGESRFYPYSILVWHEIVNDTLAGVPVLVTYCPLCATGIVFDREVNGRVQEFGVSGRLWQSNLLMYNRSGSEAGESLWSQVLGEAVLGVDTGKRLSIVRSDIVRWRDWKKLRPNTQVLSQDTGASRDYGRDPYLGYYTSDSVSFGATFSDKRLHPKAFVHGLEIDGRYKAYHDEALSGVIVDNWAGQEITITKTNTGVTFVSGGKNIPSIPGFWFSWLAVHPETELYK